MRRRAAEGDLLGIPEGYLLRCPKRDSHTRRMVSRRVLGCFDDASTWRETTDTVAAETCNTHGWLLMGHVDNTPCRHSDLLRAYVLMHHWNRTAAQ